ncbi:MAG: hypothetical protein WKF68_12915 [Daejeonella sp.]
MNENKNNPANDQEDPSVKQHQNDATNIGNDLSVGSENGSDVSDLDPYAEDPGKEKKDTARESGSSGDDRRSDDNGLNPNPDEVDPQKNRLDRNHNVENADEDELNPYPDELKPDPDDAEWRAPGHTSK